MNQPNRKRNCRTPLSGCRWPSFASLAGGAGSNAVAHYGGMITRIALRKKNMASPVQHMNSLVRRIFDPFDGGETIARMGSVGAHFPTRGNNSGLEIRGECSSPQPSKTTSLRFNREYGPRLNRTESLNGGTEIEESDKGSGVCKIKVKASCVSDNANF